MPQSITNSYQRLSERNITLEIVIFLGKVNYNDVVRCSPVLSAAFAVGVNLA